MTEGEKEIERTRAAINAEFTGNKPSIWQLYICMHAFILALSLLAIMMTTLSETLKCTKII